MIFNIYIYIYITYIRCMICQGAGSAKRRREEGAAGGRMILASKERFQRLKDDF